MVWSKGRQRIALVCLLVVYIVSVSLFGSSFQKLSPLHFALLKNGISQSIDKTTVYFGGTYFLGLGKEFISYPVHNIYLSKFGIAAKTFDKQDLKLDVSCQYKLIPEDAVTLFERLGTNYEPFYAQLLEEQVKQETVNWETSPDFYASRTEIEAAMLERIKVVFAENQAMVTDLQLRAVDLPDTIESALIASLSAEQAATTGQLLQDAELIRTSSSNLGQEASSQKRVIDAIAAAEGLALSSAADAHAFRAVVDSEAQALVLKASELSLSSAQLAAYQYNSLPKVSKAQTKVFVGLEASQWNVRDEMAGEMQ